MATKNAKTGEAPVEVTWSSAPLDVALERKGSRKPARKVKVRGILRDDWLEEEAGLPPGSVRRLLDAAGKALRHGYEPRFGESLRLVHMLETDFTNMYVSAQTMGPFFRECLRGLPFRMVHEGQEMSREDAEGLREAPGDGDEAPDEVTPDPMVTCPKCHRRFRVGHAKG